MQKNKRAGDTASFQEDRDFVMKMVHALPVFFATLNPDGTIMLINDTMSNALGVHGPEVIGKSFIMTFVPAEHQQKTTHLFNTLKKEKKPRTFEIMMQHHNGEEKLIEWHCNPVPAKGTIVDYVFCIGVDITQRKQISSAPDVQESQYRSLFESSPDSITVIDPSGTIVDCNQATADLTGFTCEELIGSQFTTLPTLRQEDLLRFAERFGDLLKGEIAEPFELEIIRKDGTKRFIEIINSLCTSQNKLIGIQARARDITEKKRAEQALRASEAKFKMFAEQSPNMIFINRAGAVVYTNRLCEKKMGYTREEFYAPDFDFMSLIAPGSRDLIKTNFGRHMRGEQVKSYEYTLIAKDGSRIESLITTALIEYENERAILGIVTDITERKQFEERIRKSEERYRNVVEQSIEGIVIAQGNPPRIVFANSAISRTFGYAEEELKSFNDAIRSLVAGNDQMPTLKRFAEVMAGDKPAPRQIQISRKDGVKLWVEIYGRRIEYGGAPALQVTVMDITSRKDMELDLKNSVAKLEKLMQNTIDSMASILETRDPYTAGHQQRVTKLAIAVAQEMGLTEEQIKGLSMAAVIHDIGKIYVPAEILSRPSILTESEMALIRTHPQVGYNILVRIEFPWPVADIVLQHHERLDGSGYPAGLKKGNIMLESMILAVADVIEAMSSHRPYRPALSLDSTLEEVAQNRGTLYDSTVVDICLRLFKEKNFTFT